MITTFKLLSISFTSHIFCVYVYMCVSMCVVRTRTIYSLSNFIYTLLLNILTMTLSV